MRLNGRVPTSGKRRFVRDVELIASRINERLQAADGNFAVRLSEILGGNGYISKDSGERMKQKPAYISNKIRKALWKRNVAVVPVNEKLFQVKVEDIPSLPIRDCLEFVKYSTECPHVGFWCTREKEGNVLVAYERMIHETRIRADVRASRNRVKNEIEMGCFGFKEKRVLSVTVQSTTETVNGAFGPLMEKLIKIKHTDPLEEIDSGDDFKESA